MTGPHTRAWGSSGYPLLPYPLRLGLDLPPLLSSRTGCDSDDDLDASWWERDLPLADGVLSSLVKEADQRLDRVLDVPLSPYPNPDQVAGWSLSTRTTNIWRRGWDDGLRSAFTVRQLRHLPSAGTRSVLDFLAAFEMSRLLPELSTVPAPPTQSLPQVGWGQPAYPLLPLCIRSRLPPDLAEASEPGRTALGMSEEQALAIAAIHLPRVGRQKIGDWPSRGELSDMPLSKRCRNAIGRVLSTRTGPFSVADLMNVQNVGIRTAVEFLCVFEIAIDTPAMGGEVSKPLGLIGSAYPTEYQSAESDLRIGRGVSEEFADLINRLKEFQTTPWVSTIRRADPRLAPYFVGLPNEDPIAIALRSFDDEGSSVGVHTLVSRTYRAMDRANELFSHTLDEALVNVVVASNPSKKNEAAVLARFGLHGAEPCSLEQAGELVGVTRERIRQIEKGLKARAAVSWIPQLDLAVAALSDHVPIQAIDVPSQLIELGCTRSFLSWSAIERAAKSFGYELDLSIVNGVVTRKSELGAIRESELRDRENLRKLRRISAPHGFAQESVVLDLFEEQGAGVPRAEIGAFLGGIDESISLDDGWWWIPRGRQGTEPAILQAQKVAIAAGRPFKARDLRRAFVRQVSYRGTGSAWAHPAPPTNVVAQWAQAFDEISFDVEHETIEVSVVDPDGVLGEAEWAIVDVLSAAPGGVATRETIIRRGVELGQKANTLSMYLTYNSIVERVEPNIWGLRGAERDSQSIDQLRVMLAKDSGASLREETIEGSTVRIRLRLSSTNIGAPVTYVSSRARELLGSVFDARTTSGRSVGTVRIDDGGRSWGYGQFMRQVGAEVDDTLIIAFNCADGSVVLDLETD